MTLINISLKRPNEVSRSASVSILYCSRKVTVWFSSVPNVKTYVFKEVSLQEKFIQGKSNVFKEVSLHEKFIQGKSNVFKEVSLHEKFIQGKSNVFKEVSLHEKFIQGKSKVKFRTVHMNCTYDLFIE